MHQLSIVHACQLVRLSRRAYYRSPANTTDRDAPIIDPLLALVAEQTRWGFWMCWKRLRALGHGWNIADVLLYLSVLFLMLIAFG